MFGTSKPLFGAPQTSTFGNPASSTGFFFAANKPATNSGFSFNSPAFSMASAPASTNFFNTPATNTAPIFNFSAASKPGSLFTNTFASSAPTTTANPFFSFAKPQTSLATNPFGIAAAGAQQPLQQQHQIKQQQSVDTFYASLSQPMMFGDERDNILARLNQLQAMLGIGTGYSVLGQVAYTPDNPFSRFRGIAYNVMPTSSEADGLVCLELSRPFTEVHGMKQGLQDTLFRLLGGRANYQLVVEEIRPAARAETNTEVIIKVVERQASGTSHAVPASDLANFLMGPSIKQHIESQLFVCRLAPELAPSSSQINAYLETPPAGIDSRVWQQARADNPDSDHMIPVPVVGFTDLKRRRADQLLFGSRQRSSVKNLLSVANGMQTHQLSISQKISQLKRKQIELNHRVLKLLAKQTVARRTGFAISADEEALRCALEHIWTEITSPRGLRTRIQQLLPTIRTDAKASLASASGTEVDGDSSSSLPSSQATWWQHPEIVDDLKEYLGQRNEGIKEMRRQLTELTTTMRVLTQKKTQLASSAASANLYPTPSRDPFTRMLRPL